MKVTNNLSTDDLVRSMTIPHTPPLLAGAFLCLVEACDQFATETVNPLLQSLKGMDQRRTIFAGLHYRIQGFCKTVMLLKNAAHQQSITSAERSVLEHYVDMELLHRNMFKDGIERFTAFIDVQKLKAARRVTKFFADNPNLDTKPSYATPHQDFIKNWESLTESKAEILWGKTKAGKPVLPEHWSQMNLPDRAEKLGKDVELRVVRGYDVRNFAVHTGLAGVVNLEKRHFEMLCALGLQTIGECALEAHKIIGKEFELYKASPDFWDQIHLIDDISTHAVADKKLQSIGEPPRFFVHLKEGQ